LRSHWERMDCMNLWAYMASVLLSWISGAQVVDKSFSKALGYIEIKSTGSDSQSLIWQAKRGRHGGPMRGEYEW